MKYVAYTIMRTCYFIIIVVSGVAGFLNCYIHTKMYACRYIVVLYK